MYTRVRTHVHVRGHVYSTIAIHVMYCSIVVSIPVSIVVLLLQYGINMAILQYCNIPSYWYWIACSCNIHVPRYIRVYCKSMLLVLQQHGCMPMHQDAGMMVSQLRINIGICTFRFHHQQNHVANHILEHHAHVYRCCTTYYITMDLLGAAKTTIDTIGARVTRAPVAIAIPNK